MSKYSETILTANGLDLATRAANGKVNFSLTRAAATSDDLTKIDLKNLTKLPSEQQSGTITNKDESIPNSQAIIGTEILFTNEGIDEGYSINAVGLYAKEEGKDEEILYAVNTAVEPEFMPNFADKVLLQFVITMYVIVGRTENVTVVVDPTGMASKEYVETRIGQVDVNDKIQISSIDNQLQKRLAYTEFKSKGSNKATQIAEMVGQLPVGLKKVDKEGNITPILPGDDGLINVGDISGGNSVEEDKDHPSAGIDYYAGSLENGEITERQILSQTPTSPTLKTNVQFLFDVGATMNRVGTGLQFMVYLQRTTITKGVIGTVTKVPFNYDPKNISKPGYYTTVAPVPMYTKAESYEVGKSNIIILEGIGEEFGLSKHKAPGLIITFNADKTMDIEPIQGYDNDGDDGGVTGYTYDPVVKIIASYNVQTAVAQLPVGINVFNGAAISETAMTAVNDYYTNVSAVKVTLSPYMFLNDSRSTQANPGSPRLYTEAVKLKDIGIQSEYILTKDELIDGFSVKLRDDGNLIKTSSNNVAVGSTGYQNNFYLYDLQYQTTTPSITGNEKKRECFASWIFKDSTMFVKMNSIIFNSGTTMSTDLGIRSSGATTYYSFIGDLQITNIEVIREDK